MIPFARMFQCRVYHTRPCRFSIATIIDRSQPRYGRRASMWVIDQPSILTTA